MSTVNVIARRWARGWELHISDEHGEEIGVTQSRTLAGAETMVRDYLELDECPAPEHIEIHPELDDDLGTRAAAARRKVREAAEAQVVAAEQSREVARQLKDAGLSGADVGAVLGVSAQRVSQLMADTKAPKSAAAQSAVSKAMAKTPKSGAPRKRAPRKVS